MTSYLLIFLGGGLGASLRYIISIISTHHLKIKTHYGTFIINFIGNFLIGFILMSSLIKSITAINLKIFLITGLAGGFTAFSVCSYEAISILNQKPVTQSFYYIALSIIFSMVGIYLGLLTGKFL
jgi:CrcB protein